MNGMEVAEVSVEALISAVREGAILIDVRTASEYARGHVPGAINLPLFDDQKRGNLLIAFAKQNRAAAFAMARRVIRPDIERFLSKVAAMIDGRMQLKYSCGSVSNVSFVVYLYCWHGGMRSSTPAWFLRQSALPGLLDCRVLRDGYRAFRRFVSSRWSSLAQEKVKRGPEAEARRIHYETEPSVESPQICIVGGRTGVGKTRVLHALRDAGEQVIDLEGVARHRGSVFGWVGRSSIQPTSEHFANLAVCQWTAKKPRWVFVEDEGPHVGKCSVHPGLFQLMRHSPLVINIVAEKKLRLHVLLEDYASIGQHTDDKWSRTMFESVGKLHRRLGRDQTEALQFLLYSRDYAAVANGLLQYYDNMYDMHLGKLRATGRLSRTVITDPRPRQGKIIEVKAFPIARQCEKPVTIQPGSLDIHRLTKDVLAVATAFAS